MSLDVRLLSKSVVIVNIYNIAGWNNEICAVGNKDIDTAKVPKICIHALMIALRSCVYILGTLSMSISLLLIVRGNYSQFFPVTIRDCCSKYVQFGQKSHKSMYVAKGRCWEAKQLIVPFRLL